MSDMTAKRKSLMPVLLIALILSIGSGTTFFIRSRNVFGGRASPESNYSLANSYVFGSPLTARGDGKEKIKVSVFLLNKNGLGVDEKQISLKASPTGLSIQNNQEITDENGQAIFYLTSQNIGRFEISTQVDNQPLPQTVTINFK